MSALFHLVEAATALSRLGETNLSPSSAYRASCLSTSSLPQVSATSLVEDNTLAFKASESIEITILRKNHLQALRAAAADGGVSLMTTPSEEEASILCAAAVQAGLVNQPPPAAPVAPLTTAPTATLRNTQQVLTELKSSATATITTPLCTEPRVNVVSSDASTASSREKFPLRLHSVLADPTVRDVVSWLPHGRSFVVLRPDVFANYVLPRYFAPEVSNSVASPTATQSVLKYPSFTRKLNRWGFRQVSRGPDAGAFCHDLFQRDDPGLCRDMFCQKSRKISYDSSRASDDMTSVCSGSTMGTGNGSGNKSISPFDNNTHSVNGKRLYSSTVTVSTAGNNNNSSNDNAISVSNRSLPVSNRSLPFKKRKSNNNLKTMSMNDIPSVISHGYQKMANVSSSMTSMTESDLLSDNGSISSGGNSCTANSLFAPSLLVPKGSNAPPSFPSTEVLVMKAALARHIQEQQYALVIASLLENSRLAIEEAGIAMDKQVAQSTSHHGPIPVEPVFASPVLVEKRIPAAVAPTHAKSLMSSVSSEDAAKAELFKAFMQAMNQPSSPVNATSSASSS